ncbi:MAG: hypothetical protein IJ634_07950 [Bacteroidales bacterium]|nr:hypothetical protein [Bacteroidales bacterium]
MKNTLRMLLIGLLSIGMAACEKEKENTNGNVQSTGALVLNEGSFGVNNASISALDITSGDIDNQWFQNANNRGLGNNAQDMVLYQSKVYVTVTESNTLEAIDPATGISTQKSMGTLKPRSIAAQDGKLYISCYTPACVVRVDAASLATEDTCLLGEFHPEGIAIAQGKAFVVSAYNDSYAYDNHLYVIDLNSFSVSSTIEVGLNPNKVEKINDNKLIVTWTGNYSDVPSGCAIIDANSLTASTVNHGLTKGSVYNGKVYGYDAPYGSTTSWLVIDAEGNVSDFPFAVSVDNNPYGININPANGDIYIMDADYSAGGNVYCYKPDGTLRFKAAAAMNPSKLILL